MTVTKRKVSVSLDEDLVAELEKSDVNLSNEINEAIRERVEHLRYLRALRAFLDVLDDEEGPVPDELLVKYREVLS